MIKRILFAVFLLAIFCFGLNLVQADYSTSKVAQRIIALDAGHGGNYPGAVNKRYGIKEKDVNLAVVKALQTQLIIAGACVVLTREGDEDAVSSRKERVKIAKEKCKSECGGECDILVSVHHNGSTNSTRDGTMAIYNHKEDFVLAEALHDALISGLKLADEGYDHGGYGMTVYFTPAAITEAYYITNDCEAELYLYNEIKSDDCNPALYPAGNRVEQEVRALYQGLVDYFITSSENGGGGGKPDNPGKGHKK